MQRSLRYGSAIFPDGNFCSRTFRWAVLCPMEIPTHVFRRCATTIIMIPVFYVKMEPKVSVNEKRDQYQTNL